LHVCALIDSIESATVKVYKTLADRPRRLIPHFLVKEGRQAFAAEPSAF
jgi:hypothetical protein